jgi:hypothetical protein
VELFKQSQAISRSTLAIENPVCWLQPSIVILAILYRFIPLSGAVKKCDFMLTYSKAKSKNRSRYVGVT